MSIPNRFFIDSDPHPTELDGYSLQRDDWWWSRPYEYAWALAMLEGRARVLDAGCGLEHPLKFLLADRGARVIGVDADPRLTTVTDPRLELHVSDLGVLPFVCDGELDAIACISTLEHLPCGEIAGVFAEWSRVLQRHGVIVLTLDYPAIPFDDLFHAIRDAGLEPRGEVSTLRGCDAIRLDRDGRTIHVWRGVLVRRGLGCAVPPPVARPGASRVLVASPVRQDPEILAAFLDGLASLDTQGFALSHLFVDDNDDPRSRELLATFAASHDTEVLHGETERRPYITGEGTHSWNEPLIWRVARYKDALLQHAVAAGFDAVFLVDSDLVLHPQTLRRLFEAHREIIAEVFWTDWDASGTELPQVWACGQYQLYEGRRDEALDDAAISLRTQAFLERLRIPGEYMVGGLGACTLIRRGALLAGVRFAELPNCTLWGEDRHFALRAAALGIPLWCDTNYPPIHVYRASDLARVADREVHFAAAEQRRCIAQTVRAALEQLAAIDWRTEPNPQTELLTERLAAEHAASLPANMALARETRLISHTHILEIREIASDEALTHARVRGFLEQTACLEGQAIRQTLSFVAELERDGPWRLAKYDIAPSRPVPTTAESATPRPIQRGSGPVRVVLSMLVRNEADRYLERVLAAVVPHVDFVSIIDDASEDDTVALCQRVAGEKLVLHMNATSGFGNEVALRQRQWAQALATGAEWVLTIDADDLFEPRVAELRELLEQDQCDVLCFRVFDMWDEEHYRDDALWCAHHIYQPLLVRAVPGFRWRWRETALHCGRIPENALELVTGCSELRIKHMGWSRAADRERKFADYLRRDRDGRFGSMAQYYSILDKHPRVYRWEP